MMNVKCGEEAIVRLPIEFDHLSVQIEASHIAHSDIEYYNVKLVRFETSQRRYRIIVRIDTEPLTGETGF